MKVACFSTKPYDRRSLEAADGAHEHEWNFFEPRLSPQTAPLAAGHQAVCAFVNDDLGRQTLDILARGGTKFIAMRCAGFDRVDLDGARELGLGVGRVPAYSPHAVAEHAVALLQTLNRQTHQARARIENNNFALEGLLGFDLYGKTFGVVGTGKIGMCMIRIALGFGCRVLCCDPFPPAELESLDAHLVELPELLAHSDIVSLHCPLLPQTLHLINSQTLSTMKRGAFLINTSRGALVDTRAAIEALESGQLGALGLDVYENESALFFEDRSTEARADELFARLISFPNVLVTGHQAFFTREALDNIAQTTLANLNGWQTSGSCPNPVL